MPWKRSREVTMTLFGLFAVTAMLVTYALERRHAGFILAFAGACLLGSVYGFLQGAWPFGPVEAIWAVGAARGPAARSRPRTWRHRPAAAARSRAVSR